MTKVLFPLHGLINWNGGIDLARLIVSAMDRQTSDTQIELVFALPVQSPARRFALFLLRAWREIRAGRLGFSTGRANHLRKAAQEIAAGRTILPCGDDSAGILRVANECGADIVFPTMNPLGEHPIARVGYIFDFQHLHLPDMFPERIRRNRSKHFRRIAEDSTGIVVNARSVAQDVAQVLDFPNARILSMPFAPYAHPWWFELDPLATCERYGIRHRYALVCNHFWKHKDHATALRAFAMLRKSLAPENLQLVLTGDPVDHRDPAHFRQLLALCDELGIAGSTRFLGLIPKRDQLALLRGAAVLVQPTLFEGGPGGGAVAEAIGMGTPAVVSDIPVNREVDQGDVRFFRAGDAADLAEKALNVLVFPPRRPDTATLLANAERNLSKLGDAIVHYLLRIASDA